MGRLLDWAATDAGAGSDRRARVPRGRARAPQPPRARVGAQARCPQGTLRKGTRGSGGRAFDLVPGARDASAGLLAAHVHAGRGLRLHRRRCSVRRCSRHCCAWGTRSMPHCESCLPACAHAPSATVHAPSLIVRGASRRRSPFR